MQWENVHIFISSTFNDMHAERDYLVKSVFPALSEWCEERKLRLIDIDLRWGVTAADSEAKNTVRACLRNIDECRPFFLCFLGQRRGWVPGVGDIGEDTYELFPKLEEKGYVGEASVTEMEILHALIDPLHGGVLRGTKDDGRSGQAVEHAFFYLRDPGYLDGIPHPDLRAVYTNEAERDPATADLKLARWKGEEIPKTGRPVKYYATEWQQSESTPEIALPLCVPTTAPAGSDVWKALFVGWKNRWAAAGVAADDSGEITGAELDKAKAYNERLTSGRLGGFSEGGAPLAEAVIGQLKGAIAKRFPDHMVIEALTPLQKELDQQAQFLRIASEGFIERAGDMDGLGEYVRNDERRPLAVTAFAGMGKTSLLAHFIDTFTAKDSESLHYRFIGGSDDSVSVERLIRSLLNELKEAGKLISAAPADTNDMMNQLPGLLAEAGGNGKTILVIDALNQLESGMSYLNWIPTELPEGVKMVVSFKRGEESNENGMAFYSVKPFDSVADRKALVSTYLEQYFKELDEPRIQALVTSDGAENPLFLKAALSELRVFGVHNDLAEVIRTRFGNTPAMAFNAILSRMESDPAYTGLTPNIALPHIFGWIAHSRYGMGVDELADLFVYEKLAESRADAIDAIYLILRQLRPFIAKRDGRVDFFYESFKIAARGRYTGSHPYARSEGEWHRSLAGYFGSLSLENRHKLMEQAWQYAMAGMSLDYENLLLDYRFVETRLREFDVDALVSDYDHLDGKNTKLVQSALKLSENVLASDKEQLASQLWGRLIDRAEPEVKQMLAHMEDIQREAGKAWLRLERTSLGKAGSSLAGVLSCICEPVLTGDKKKVLMATGQSVNLIDLETMKTEDVYPIENPVKFIVSDDGSSIIYASGGLFLFDTQSKKSERLDSGEPETVSFNPYDIHMVLYNDVLGVIPDVFGKAENYPSEIRFVSLTTKKCLSVVRTNRHSRYTISKEAGLLAILEWADDSMPRKSEEPTKISVFDVKTGKLKLSFDTWEITSILPTVRNIAFSPCGKKLYLLVTTYGVTPSILVIDVSTGTHIDTYPLTGSRWGTLKLIVSPDGRYLAYSYRHSEYDSRVPTEKTVDEIYVLVYDSVLRAEKRIKCHSEDIYIPDFDFTNHGELAVQPDTTHINIISLPGGDVKARLAGQTGVAKRLLFSYDDSRLITFADEMGRFSSERHKAMRVFDTAVCEAGNEEGDIYIRNIIWHGDRQSILGVTKKRAVYSFNRRSQKWAPFLSMPLDSFFTGIVSNREGSMLGREGMVPEPKRHYSWVFYDLVTGEQHVLDPINEYGTDPAMNHVTLLPDGRTVVSSESGTVFIRDVVTGSLIRKIHTGNTNVAALMLPEDEGKLITAGKNYKHSHRADTTDPNSRMIELPYNESEPTIKAWDIETGELLNDFGGFSLSVGAAALSLDGTKVAAICHSSRIEVFDARTGNYEDTIPAAAEMTSNMLFISDDLLLVYDSNNLHVLDVARALTLSRFTHDGRIEAFICARDCGRIAFLSNHFLEIGVFEGLDAALAAGRPRPLSQNAAPERSTAELIEKASAAFKDAKADYGNNEYISAAELYKNAAADYQEVYERQKGETELAWAAHSDVMAGQCYYQQSNTEEQKKCYLRALPRYELLTERFGEKYLPSVATVLSNLGFAYGKDDADKAIEYYERCLKVQEKLIENEENDENDEKIAADHIKVKNAIGQLRERL